MLLECFKITSHDEWGNQIPNQVLALNLHNIQVGLANSSDLVLKEGFVSE